MYEKILIANRGEIAAGILKSCRSLGIKTACVYSEADWDALHIKIADEAYCIGRGSGSKASYINISEIIDTALASGADAIHPGWGFLAENHLLARACEDAGIGFIGPDSTTLEKAGRKILAKELVESIGLPVVPGRAVINDVETLLSEAEKLGYPVLLKADTGKGGRFIVRLDSDQAAADAFRRLNREMTIAGETGGIFIEKYLENAYHIEFPLLADEQGNIVVFPEMNCSLQRRFQKLLVESPTTVLEPSLRDSMVEMTISIARAFDYRGAAGVEYLVDTDGNVYFLEINPRLPVERGVAEVLTGVDMLEEQIRISCGEALEFNTGYLTARGWAMECRINAEDPENNFTPVPGNVVEFSPPGGTGIRVDAGVYSGYEIPIYYDSCIAKVIVNGRSRENAIRRMASALRQFTVRGVSTTIPFFKNLLCNEYFLDGQVTTDFSQHELFLSLCKVRDIPDEVAAILAALDIHVRHTKAKRSVSGFKWGSPGPVWGVASRLNLMNGRNL
ncbi:MAG: acetyl-CoA carboxylase biotin carboxylase subunit [Candidatus Wallbacteria bacterium HGW-Wallbacteria-1]|jgi:acetyl-CoA carboxylase biotin carboxylase subunit|uniref:biotin carboxylase n=1 Tax=Candidatus Wallbacteria bacterium HGW-Wallbacteria-1 TaxID=2013854 RepID=A0A2N1PPA5_9BACT|nr:MAG: acetyl-CoA carboxylase biotin carboxylase subunit [Candidatus Wallbacteria bacterium HGW-Wallbacteria-1]